MTDSIDRAKKIKVILFDVDGVLTDGSIWLFPAPASGPRSTDAHAEKHADKPGFAIISQNMIEAKGFNAHDGTAISLARLGGLKTGMVTKRISETVALRARDLKIDYLYQGAQNKSDILDKILAESGFHEEQTASVGGHGAARDAVEYILEAQGTLEKVIEEYVQGIRVRESGERR